jgi:hypothetical protein
MPRIKFVARRLICAGLLAAGCAGIGAAQAAADIVTVNDCSAPTLTQPFLSWGDQNYYALAPGQDPGSFNGTGWTLTRGASVVTTTLADGSTNTVLDLPSGSRAVSPTMCVDSTYPTARAMVRDVGGPGGVGFLASYQNTSGWNYPQFTAWIGGTPGADWTPSNPINLQPSTMPGWQLARFTFVAAGVTGSEFQLYNFYVDPYRKG